MFNLDIMEVVLVLLVAFLVVGPKDLPRVARWIARMVKKARAFIRDVKKEIGWDEIMKDITSSADDIKETIKDADVTAEIRSASKEVKQSFGGMKDDVRKVDEDVKANANK